MKKSTSSKILECVPNFSEGRNKSVIEEIKKRIAEVKGVKILHIDTCYSANRTVFSFAGPPEAVIESAFRGVQSASQLIDMRKHKGIHPRIGAADIVPLVPVRGLSMEEVVSLSYQLAERIARELNIPVFCYEKSSRFPDRKKLENIRKGEYEGLKEKISDPNWKPDYGPDTFNAKSGATILGARKCLVAFNINLNTKSVKAAKVIAGKIRSSGKTILVKGLKKRIPGLLKHVKAIGWFVEEYKKAQVSLNLTDINKTPVHVAFETVKNVAKKLGYEVTGSEIIGLIPEKALVHAGKYYAAKNNRIDLKKKSAYIDLAVKQLGLNDIRPFVTEEIILEYVLVKQ
jgi:glutamate formiminotransferase / formiminotetrahydrofolate cyclodeaminase